MSNKEGEDFYHSLSRKELQSLCKKYGFPARKSSSKMAESLFSYFQKKNLSFACSGKSVSGTQEVLLPPSSRTTLQAEAPLDLTENALKDSCQPRSNPREEGNKGNGHMKCNELGNCMGIRAHDKECFGSSIYYFQGTSQSQFVSQCAGSAVFHNEPCSSLIGRVENTPQFHYGHINEGVWPKENISAITTYAKVPASFEFYVNSEEGINLCVDLNANPLDWIKKYKNQVSFCKNAGNAKSGGLHQELGCIGESNTQMKNSFPQSEGSGEIIKDGHTQAEPSPSLVIEEDNVEIDCPEGINKLLEPLPSIPCSAEGSDCLGEDKGPISSKPTSDVQVQIISHTESCTKNGSSATLMSDITDTPTEKTACNFAVNSISDGSVDLIVIGHQNLKHDDEVCENSILQNNSNLENNCVVPGCLASCCTEMQLSETGNCRKEGSCSPNKNGVFLDMDDSKHNIAIEQAALTTSSENDRSRSHLPTCSEDHEWSNINYGRESSVCSQVDNSVRKTCMKSVNLELKEECQKKRSIIDSEGQDSCSKRDTKILRNMHSAAEVLPRRSMRLVSK